MPRPVPCCSRLIFLLLFLLTPAPGFSWPARVVTVLDGDSIIVQHGDRQKEVRLYGIDCPEKGQESSQQAKALTTALVAGREVEVTQMDTDHYGRVVGLVKVDGQNLGALIVQNGYAWVYRPYCKERFCTDWLHQETLARQQKKGMWKDQVVVAPWEWRAAQREKKQAGQSPAEVTPPVIIIGEKQQETRADPSLLARFGKALGVGSAAEKGTSGAAPQARYRCDGRTLCSQMRSCEEATFFVRNCPGVKMDGDGDGVPCERQWCR